MPRLGRRQGSSFAFLALLIGSLSTFCFVCGPHRLKKIGNPLTTDIRRFGAVAEAPALQDLQTQAESAGNMTEEEFWRLVDDSKVSEVIISSWSEKQLLARVEGELVAVVEDSEVEDLRNELLVRGIPVRYPAGEELSDEDALARAELSSEGPVAGGLLSALALGIADSLVEISASVAVPALEVEGQSLMEAKPADAVVAEDLGLLNKDLRILERAVEGVERSVEADFQAAESLASQEANQATGFFGTWLTSVEKWGQDVWTGLWANHAPGPGGLIEDSFMGLLSAVSLFSLFQMAFLKRKSNSFSGLMHTATGAMQIGVVLYAIIEERCLRESPGVLWAISTWIIFMVNNITMWPLLKYFRGPEVQRVLFKLAYSFIISFQGIHAIAWSYQYPWLYWVVMPYWFWSVKKLFESSDNILALVPEGTVPAVIQESARRRVKGIQNDTPTWVYSILNFGGAVFDNLYMAVYTWRGPSGFWGWSAANIPAVNDHLRTGLVKPCFGSLTISVLVFLATLVYRKKVDRNLALALNVVLASVGPWLILYYHKLVDWDEPWQPELNGDWPSTAYLAAHLADIPALLAIPLSIFGAGSMQPAAATEALGQLSQQAL